MKRISIISIINGERKVDIKNVRLINPATSTDEIVCIIVDKGKIVEIVDSKDMPEEAKDSSSTAAECIQGDSRLICVPGLIDTHSHFRDPGFTYKEDIESGSIAALVGGYTSIVLMGNTKPPVDNVETLQYVLDKGKKTGIKIYSGANVTKGMEGKELTDMEALKEAGAICFTDDGKPIMDEELLRAAFIKAKELNVPVALHEEDPAYITNNGINAGEAAKKLGVVGSPREAEISMIKRDIEIAKETGVDLIIQHISTKEGVELVREARKTHKNIHAEATPHHFSLTEQAVLEHGANAKVNPPLRTEEDRQAIIEGLKDGTIEIIATDHAPHSKEEKEQELTQAPSGMIGLQVALSLGIRELVDTGYLTLSQLIEKLTVNPAKIYHLEDIAGSVEVGRDADMTLIDLDAQNTFTGFGSKSKNSPFIGTNFKGIVGYTIHNGRIYR